MPLFSQSPYHRWIFLFFTASLIALVSFAASREHGNVPLEAIAVAAPAAPPAPPSGPVDFDFDGDGKSDIGRWHPATSEFKVRNSNGGSFLTYTIGPSSAKAAPGDYDRDGKTDAAVFNAGTWKIRGSFDGTELELTFGQAGDIPMAADYDGDGKTDLAFVRPSTTTWWVKRTTDGAIVPQSSGNATDIPVPGDYDADGKTDIALYRPATGGWTVNYSSNSSVATASWGQAGTDVPVPADYDGDGKTDLAVFRRSTGTWYVVASLNGQWLTQAWGNYGDQPVPADYDGDNKADFSIWRPTTGVWHTVKSSTGGFDAQSLGQAGDTAIPSAYLKQVGGTVSAYELAQSRLSPKNATGGTDLYSRNFSWGTSLVSLPGRAGLNAGFGISYNSLVWTRSGGEIHFDADVSDVGPGFRMGFPTVEPAYFDTKTGNFAYLMVTPSGGRVEFRQIGATNVYETADSSYLQLKAPVNSNPNDPVENLTLIVTGTDGTQMTYVWKGGAFRCSQIKDRNGNYITIVHNDEGKLASMTDTLGRVVTVEYDGWGQPSAIKQMWGGGTNGSGSLTAEHTWASFSYTNTTVSTDFDGSLNVVGPPNTTSLRVLDKITYSPGATSNGGATKFHYNGYAQVYKVENLAPNGDSLNYVRLNSLQFPNGNQFDSPKFNDRRSWAKDFNNNAEVVTANSLATGQPYTPPTGPSRTVTRIEVATVGHPNNLVSKTFVGESGWAEGLPVATEDWTEIPNGWTRQRWTWTNYTQDNESLTYPLNPRVIETRVGDAANTKKTTIAYHMTGTPGVALYGLVKKVEVGDLSTVLKKQETDYNLSSVFLLRRIIGLPAETRSWGRDDSTTNLDFVAKTVYSYDQSNFGDPGQDVQDAFHHDYAQYGSSIVGGRGNLTTVTTCDATNSGDTPGSPCGGGISSTIKYNTTGAAVSKTTPWNGTSTRTVQIGYADDFNGSVPAVGGVPVSTHAYPTSFTDPAGNSSTVEYRFDIGANVWAKSPHLNPTTPGKETTRVYDDKGRIQKETIVNNGGAYTRYEYPTNGTQSQVFSTIIDADNDGAGTADEVLREAWSDGAGRVVKARTEHPGSLGGWSAVKTEYDILGRVHRQSVPTEVDAGWAPSGDDLARQWVWNTTEYDWMGRTKRSIPSDSTGTDGKDTLISYEGCGCAGGLKTTVLGPLVPRDDLPGSNARRKLKIYEDILGRRTMTETFAWDGTTVHSTVSNLFNGRDQVVKSTRYAGGTSSTTSQDTTATFDGYGRLEASHRPEQMDTNGNPLSTSYSYYPDGSIKNVVDARGAITNTTYNVLGLPLQRTSTMPAAGPTPTPSPGLNTSVAFEYDNVGNRKKMTDSMGTVDYVYNSLGQMTSETRQFTESMQHAPSGGFKLEYGYTLTGQLKWYKDPFGQQINHGVDRTGRLTDVTGSGFGGVTGYANDAEYRAWGGLKEVGYGSGMHLALSYNDRLLPNGYDLEDPSQAAIMDKAYSYYPDAKLSYTQDLVAPKFDRLNRYNSIGKVSTGFSGGEARGETVAENDRKSLLPYRQSFEFDVFGNLTASNNMHWGVTSWSGESFNRTFEYTNNRIDQVGVYYDDDGRNTFGIDESLRTYNAEGRLVQAVSDYARSVAVHDGDGREVKRQISRLAEEDWEPQPAKYYIRSSVMGGRVVSEVWGNGRKHRTYVKGIGNETAVQSAYASETAALSELVLFEFSDSSGMSYRTTDTLGELAATGNGGEGAPIETDPLGGSVGTHTPYVTLGGGGGGFGPRFPQLQPFNYSENPSGPNFESLYAVYGSHVVDLPGFGTNWGSFADLAMMEIDRVMNERLGNSVGGLGFVTNAQAAANAAGQQLLEDLTAAYNPSSGGAGGDDGTRTGGDETGDNGGWVDQTTTDEDLITATVTIRGGGYWDFGSESQARGLQTRDGKVPLTTDELKYVRENFGKVLTKTCLDYINTLARAHSGNQNFDATLDLLKAFDHVRDSAPEWGFRWFTGNFAGRKEITLVRPASGNILDLNLLTVVHELIHTAMMNVGPGAAGADLDLTLTVEKLGITVYRRDGKVFKRDPNSVDDRQLWAEGLRNNCPDTYGRPQKPVVVVK